MNIQVNGKAREVAACDLHALIVELDYEDGPVATALNGAFVRKKDRAGAQLKDGDSVEIVAPRQGG